MADIAQRLSVNIPGRYYVDATCIDCDVCRQTAPDSFGVNRELAKSYVQKQPASREELLLMEEALDSCPTESIGNNG